jgi:Rps23 Pro-64 3,4-dihydroxylase Tpa1-like proline 4-hydroxylase
MDAALLQSAREELVKNCHATLKETDIYKVYQTGDLANLDGLTDAEKALFPASMSLRNALYSLEFRKQVSEIVQCGPLSGKNIDLSVNAYGHTGHLLCHDDVIGSRVVSFILYLVEKDWDSELEGGALRLYPLKELGIPETIPSKLIPARFNQMVMFGVQPGKSFHDVEEVLSRERPRLAVSGWFHVASEDELDDWPEHIRLRSNRDLELAPASIEQLKIASEDDAITFSPLIETEEGMNLASFINAEYLKDATIRKVSDMFDENGSTLQLYDFLKGDIVLSIVESLRRRDSAQGLGNHCRVLDFATGSSNNWEIIGPPHKRRYLRLVSSEGGTELDSALFNLSGCFQSALFGQWIEKMIGVKVIGQDVEVRRFRPGLDYTLAVPQKWNVEGSSESYMVLEAIFTIVDDAAEEFAAAWAQDEVGGYLTYLDSAPSDRPEEEGHDAAVYKSSDSGSLLSVSACSNSLSLVLKDDPSILSFVKYLNCAAPGSRLDFHMSFLIAVNEDAHMEE